MSALPPTGDATEQTVEQRIAKIERDMEECGGGVWPDVARWLISELRAARKDKEALLRFAGAALTDARIQEIGDWDGAGIEEAMCACGLIVETQRLVPCQAEGCRCAEFYGYGEMATCYPLSDLGREAVRVFRAYEDSASADVTPRSATNE